MKSTKNWEPSRNAARSADLKKFYDEGKRQFLINSSVANLELTDEQLDQKNLWDDSKSLNGLPLFVMDTRTERSYRDAVGIDHAEMIFTRAIRRVN